MKTFASFTMLSAVAVCSFAGQLTLEDISPHFSTNMPIIWKAPISSLPKSFWIYKKLPRVFSATTISNAIILASFQHKRFPQPSTNRTILWADRADGEPRPPYFEISPEWGEIFYSLGDRAPDSTEKVANDEAAVQRAWDCLRQLGIDRSEFIKTNAAGSGTWRVFLPRQIDGIQIYDESEGFSFQQFGGHGKIRSLWLALPNLERQGNSPTGSPQQIIACIRAFKTPLIPGGKPDYFARVKTLAKAEKLIISEITPFYGEGIYGQAPTNDGPAKFVTPVAELDAVADFGNSNMLIRLFSPITVSEVARLTPPNGE